MWYPYDPEAILAEYEKGLRRDVFRWRAAPFTLLLVMVVLLLVAALAKESEYLQSVAIEVGAGVGLFVAIIWFLGKGLSAKGMIAVLAVGILMSFGGAPVRGFWRGVLVSFGVNFILFVALEVHARRVLSRLRAEASLALKQQEAGRFDRFKEWWEQYSGDQWPFATEEETRRWAEEMTSWPESEPE